MSKIKARIKVQFPMVLLTLISIIQALALELLWGKVVASDYLFGGGIAAVVSWGMVTVCFLGIIQIWVLYSTMVMGVIWQPLIRDSVFPFIIGVQEFLMVSLVDAQFNPLWLFVLASIFISANWMSHNSLRRARQDPDNAQFFNNIEPARLKDFIPLIGIVAALTLMGILGLLTNNQNWLPLLAIVLTNLILLLQILASRRLWRRVLALPGEEEN
ncbi:MAG: hypothetical protein O2971_15160 [Proteobacteria bacterium]|nr:hypothetical protein [Pseudomonadota bacterium]